MRVAFAFICALLLSFQAACTPQDEPDKVPLILAAASLQEALEAAADEWAAQGHERPVLSFAATSALARQIEAGAPGDLFISADERWMDEVAAKGFLKSDTRENFLGNSLVLIAPAREAPERDAAAQESGQGEITSESPLFTMLAGGRLAMADPEAVPAGRYGKEALVSLGLWASVSDSIASAENVRAAMALVERGAAPLGVVYASDAVAEPGVRVVGSFPAKSHSTIIYPIAQLSGSASSDAENFRQFLLSDEGQVIFRRFGFSAT